MPCDCFIFIFLVITKLTEGNNQGSYFLDETKKFSCFVFNQKEKIERAYSLK